VIILLLSIANPLCPPCIRDEEKAGESGKSVVYGWRKLTKSTKSSDKYCARNMSE
jgi:hypothetical protein